MHPRDHPLLLPKNLLELLFQSPFWIFIYGTGAVFLLNAFAWLIYGLGWYMHPKRYPMPHAALLDLVAETMLWLRNESELPKSRRNGLITILAIICVVVIPLFFLVYVEYLFWLYFGEEGPFLRVIRHG